MELQSGESISTTKALIDAARDLFAKYGYDAVSAAEIAKAAGTSRDSFYLHFSGKLELFENVVCEEFKKVRAIVFRRASGAGSPLSALIEAGDAFVTACSDSQSYQILFADAPRVLGQQHMQEKYGATSDSALRLGVIGARLSGHLPSDIDVDAVTSLMSGAYDRAVIDGGGGDYEAQLKSRQAIRAIWMGLSKLAQAEDRRG